MAPVGAAGDYLYLGNAGNWSNAVASHFEAERCYVASSHGGIMDGYGHESGGNRALGRCAAREKLRKVWKGGVLEVRMTGGQAGHWAGRVWL